MPKHPRTCRSLYLTVHESDLIAKSLRAYADRLIKADNVDVEEARALDRALRSCPGIADIDWVWPRWVSTAQDRGWLTDEELGLSPSGRYTYQPTDNDDR